MPERAREIAELIVAASAGSVATGLFGWLQRRTSNRAEDKTGEAAILGAATRLQEVMNDAAKATVADLRADLDAVREEAQRLREEADRLRERLDQVEGENRQMKQHSESLESILRRRGIDLSAISEPGALTIVDQDQVSVTRPSRRRRKS